MKLQKRLISILLITVMLSGMVPGLFQRAFAAVGTVNVSLESYLAGTLNIRWDLVPNRGATYITYHVPNTDNTAAIRTLPAILSTAAIPNKAAITGLKSDYIYDITVDVYDSDNLDGSGHPTGNIIATDIMYFFPQISLYSESVDQQYVDDVSGGRESGVFPTLKVSWTRPKVYDGAGNFIDVKDIASFSKIDPQLRNFSYTINVTDSAQRSDVIVNFNSITNSYEAKVSGDPDNTRISKVNYDTVSGKLYFYLLGIKEDTAHLPSITEVSNDSLPPDPAHPDLPAQKVLPTKISSVVNERFYVLPDKDILPGTVYYLKISSLYFDGSNNYLDVVTSGPSGNPLTGLPYTYTPLRFQLTKNSMDNVNVKIYKVNQGSLSMPQMYYHLQLNSVPSSDDSSWDNSVYKDKEKKLDGTYFTGAFAYTVVSGIGVNNNVYYRVTVRTASSTDKIESIKTPYIISADTSRPPVPKNVLVQPTKLSAGVITVQGQPLTVKSSDIKITWDKPANWDQIRMPVGSYDPAKDVYFHFTINTSQNVSTALPYPDLIADGQNYGSFPLKYRLVKYVSANSPNIVVNGNKLEYTLSAFDIASTGNLFQWENNLGADGAPAIPNGEGYPTCLLPNTVYYIRMYTTSAADKGTIESDPNATSKMSDMSLTTSFTTLSGSQRDVPLPSNFRAVTGADQGPWANYIQLQFDKVKIDWNNYTINHDPADAVYYDIYMSNRLDPNSFVMIGTTERTDTSGPVGATKTDIIYDKLADSQSVYITAKIKSFRNGITYTSTDGLKTYDPYAVFGTGLLPNSTYYFIVKTRLVMANPPVPPNSIIIKESISTAVLPVTTIRTEISTGDTTTKRHVAPTDFAIAKDANGNQRVSGQTVTFTWSKKESAPVKFELICTTAKVGPDDTVPPAPGSILALDPTFTAFKSTYNTAYPGVIVAGSLELDPASVNTVVKPSYNAATKLYTFTISKFISPNKLYYFSLRVKSDSLKESVWISIPVTTTLIEGPTMLEAVNDTELGLSWNGATVNNARVEDFRISIKGPKDTAYQVLTRAQAMLIMDPKGNLTTDYYLRIYKLLSNTKYEVLIENPLYDIAGRVTGYQQYKAYTGINAVTTKDDNHHIEVKWKGLPVDNFAGFQIAIKRIEDPDYILLEDTDLEMFTDISGNSFPYFIEKSNLLLGTTYSIYHARIKTVQVTLADGTKQRQPLKANTKYYVKVRAYKKDPSDPTAYSKYIGPVNTRTEFNQADYDKTDQDLKKTALFMDKIAKLEEKLFWRLGMSNPTIDKLFLKGDRVINAMENSNGAPFTLDISDMGAEINTDVVYMPLSVVETMNNQGKSLVIKSLGGEFTFKPQTLDLENLGVVKTVKGKSGVQDVYLKFTITRVDYPKTSLPTGAKSISKVNDLEVQVMGSSKKDTELKASFKDKLYNDKTGLIKQKTESILSYGSGSTSQTQEQVDEYVNTMVQEVEADMADYIGGIIEGTGSTAGMILVREEIKTFSNPMIAKLSYGTGNGKRVPYLQYDTSTQWQKLTQNILDAKGTLSFSVTGTGKFSVMTLPSPSDTLSGDYWAKSSIDKLTAKYDLSDIFIGMNQSFNPEISVSAREVILLYEKLLNKTGENWGKDIRQKMKSLGLETVFGPANLNQDINRQEFAVVLVRIYGVKMGVHPDSLKAGKSIFVNDESEISTKNYKACVLALDMEILSLDTSNNFNPLASLTRAEVVWAFEKVLELTGDIQ